MSGARHRRKGDRVEREIVQAHTALGVKAERYPLSGASRFRGSGHDIDIYAFGADEAPLVAEVKARKNRQRLRAARALVGRVRRVAPPAQQRRPAGVAAVADMGALASTGAPMTSRERLPNRRASTRFAIQHDGATYLVTLTRFSDGRIAELFIDAAKPDSALAIHVNDAAVLASLLLQHGVTAAVIKHSLAGPIATALAAAEEATP
jgi:hypothetical protein